MWLAMVMALPSTKAPTKKSQDQETSMGESPCWFFLLRTATLSVFLRMKNLLLWKSTAAGLLLLVIAASAVLTMQRKAPSHSSTEPASSVAPDRVSTTSTPATASAPARVAQSTPTDKAISKGFTHSSPSSSSAGAPSSGRWYATADSSSTPDSPSAPARSNIFDTRSSSSPSVANSSQTSSPGAPFTSVGTGGISADVEVVEQAPLPVSAQLAGYNVEGLTPEEQEAVTKAQNRFSEDVNAAPNQDTSDPGYYNDWEKARQSNDSYLRSVLGWRTFNGLSSEGAQAMLEQQRAAAQPN